MLESFHPCAARFGSWKPKQHESLMILFEAGHDIALNIAEVQIHARLTSRSANV